MNTAEKLEREAFEKWGRSVGMESKYDGGFDYPLGRALWQAWQGRGAMQSPPSHRCASDDVGALARRLDTLKPNESSGTFVEVRGVKANGVEVPLVVLGACALRGGKTGVFVTLPQDF